MADRVSRSVIEFNTEGTDKVTSSFDKVERKARGTDQSVGKLGSSMGSLTTAFKAFIALEVTQRLVSGLGALVEAVDEFDTLASRIGATVEDAQQLKAVASTFDTELETIVTGIQVLRERLGEGKLDEPLRKLNIEMDQFRKLDGKEAYLQVAEALAQIEDPAERAALAKKLLGGQAKELAATFRTDVRDGMSGVITISNETAEAIDLLSVAWAKGKQNAVAFGSQLLATMTGLQAYVRMKELFGAPELPEVDRPEAFAAAGKATLDLAMNEKELEKIEKELTRTAKERIQLNEKAITATGNRQEREREYYNWLGERQMAAAAAEMAAIEKTEKEWREYYNWLGERRMEAEGAAMALDIKTTARPIDIAQTMEPFKKPVTENVHESVLSGFEQAAAELPDLIKSALTGGGDLGQSIGGLFGGALFGKDTGLTKTISGGLGKALGSKIGGAVGSIIPGLGTVLGAFAGKGIGALVGKLFGGEGKKVNDLRDQFTSAAGGIDVLAEKAAKAGLTLDRFYKAKTVKDFEAATAELTGAIEAQAAATSTLFDEIMDAGASGIPEAMRPAIDQLLSLGILTDDQAAKLRGLKDAAVDVDQMKADLDVFKGRIESLGPAFKQAEIDQTAGEYVNAIDRMIRGGGDVGGILFDAREELGALVVESMKSKTTLPANLKPWIDDLVRSGNLIDENGEKITDVSQLQYGDEMKTEAEVAEEGWDKILLAIETLIDKINGPLHRAIDNIPTERTIRVGVEYEDGEGGGPDPGMSSGTFGRYGNFWHNFGRQTRAMLHGVEAVVRPDQAPAFAASVLASMGGSGGGSDTPLVMTVDGTVLARAVIRRTGRQLSIVGV